MNKLYFVSISYSVTKYTIYVHKKNYICNTQFNEDSDLLFLERYVTSIKTTIRTCFHMHEVIYPCFIWQIFYDCYNQFTSTIYPLVLIWLKVRGLNLHALLLNKLYNELIIHSLEISPSEENSQKIQRFLY